MHARPIAPLKVDKNFATLDLFILEDQPQSNLEAKNDGSLHVLFALIGYFKKA